MSFFLTQDQIRNKTKTVTRRLGWDFLKPGDIVNAVEKAQGLKKGEKIKVICRIRILSIMKQPLYWVIDTDVKAEGFPEMTPGEFIEMFCKYNKCKNTVRVNRIHFEYVE